MSDKFIPFIFNYASISLKPYTGNKGTSTQLLKTIINKLNEKDFPSDKRVINRHENRTNSVDRKLVMISSAFVTGGTRCFGKIALIKNKNPMIWGGKDIIEEIQKEANKQFIEITNFVIQFTDNADPILMYEFNSEGPRQSDIEYYIRQIAKEFHLAKHIQTSIHLTTTYDQLDKEMKNVFGITVKVNTVNNNKFSWLAPLKTLSTDTGFRDIRFELSFNRSKDPSGSFKKNIRGLDFARGIIASLNKDKDNIEYLDDLKLTYQNKHNEIVDLDFLKNKVNSYLEIPLTDRRLYKATDFKDLVGQEFNYYLATGNTHN